MKHTLLPLLTASLAMALLPGCKKTEKPASAEITPATEIQAPANAVPIAKIEIPGKTAAKTETAAPAESAAKVKIPTTENVSLEIEMPKKTVAKAEVQAPADATPKIKVPETIAAKAETAVAEAKTAVAEAKTAVAAEAKTAAAEAKTTVAEAKTAVAAEAKTAAAKAETAVAEAKTAVAAEAKTAAAKAETAVAEAKTAVEEKLPSQEEIMEQAKKQFQQIEKEINDLLAFIPETIATYGTNGKISGNEVKMFLKQQLFQAKMQGMNLSIEKVKELAQNIAKQMGAMNLAIQEGKAKGFSPDPKEVEKEINDALAKDPAGKIQLEEMLKNDNLTLADLVEKECGMRTLQNYVASLTDKVTTEAVKAYYESNWKMFTTLHASHILAAFGSQMGAAPTEEQKAAAKTKILAAQKALQEGKDFAALAKEVSDCPSKEQGGDLGDFQPGSMVPPFEEALLKLKEGEVSGIVETSFGYHLIKAGACKPIPFEEVKEKLQKYLEQQTMIQKGNEIIQRFLSDPSIKVLIP